MAKITLTHLALAALLLNLWGVPIVSAAAPPVSSPPRFSLLALPAPDAAAPPPWQPASLLAADAAAGTLLEWSVHKPDPEARQLAQESPKAREEGLLRLARGGVADVGAGAGEERSHDWRWRRAGWKDYAGVSVLAVGTAYFEHANGRPTEADWTARNGFDESIRDALRLNSRSARDATNLAGDVIMGVMIAAPVLDAFATLGIRDGEWDALWQTEMVNLEAFTFTSLISSLTQNLLARERPFVRNCEGGACADRLENRGFPSGHVAFAFTGAGLICNHHKYQSLYRDPAADRAACATGIGLAVADGILRIVSDSHYATDVLAGSALGLFSGFVLPRLLHYSRPQPPDPNKKQGAGSSLLKQISVVPLISGNATGLTCEFRF